jgi:hypothetical protein
MSCESVEKVLTMRHVMDCELVEGNYYFDIDARPRKRGVSDA